MAGAEQLTHYVAQLTDAADKISGMLKTLRADVTSLEGQKVTLAAEVATAVAKAEPMRKEAEGQGRATKEAYEQCRQARMELERVETDLAKARTAAEKEMAALRKKADSAYSERVADKEAELAGWQAKIAAAHQAFEDYRRKFLA